MCIAKDGRLRRKGGGVPDREDTAGLSEVGLLLDTADSLLEDGRPKVGGAFASAQDRLWKVTEAGAAFRCIKG